MAVFLAANEELSGRKRDDAPGLFARSNSQLCLKHVETHRTERSEDVENLGSQKLLSTLPNRLHADELSRGRNDDSRRKNERRKRTL